MNEVFNDEDGGFYSASTINKLAGYYNSIVNDKYIKDINFNDFDARDREVIERYKNIKKKIKNRIENSREKEKKNLLIMITIFILIIIAIILISKIIGW